MDTIGNNKPRVSVFINTRNRAKLIPRALNSLSRQTFCDYEVVILDADSTDETELVIKNYIKKDKRIRYIKYNNEKLATCLNYLISKCSGEYITQLDDDDEYYPEKIQKQVHLLDNSPKKVGVVYCWEEFWDDRSDTKLYNNKPSVRGDAYLKLLEKSCVGGGTTMMMRKSACDFVGGLDESIKLAADYQLNINLSKHYNHDFVPEVLVRTHINHNYNRLTDMKVPIMQHADMIEYIEKILHDHKDAFDQYPHLRFNHYRSIMHSAAKNRDFATFVKYLKLGFALTDSFQEKLLYSSRGIKHFILSK